MAITNILAPAALNFSKNFIPVEFLSDSYLDSYGVAKENYSVYLEIWVEDATQTAFYLASQQNLPLRYNLPGKATTDLKEILNNILMVAGPDFINHYITTPLNCPKSIRKFYLKYAESIDGANGSITTTATFTVAYGGLSYLSASATSLVDKIVPDGADATKDKFLKQGTIQQYTRTNQPQFLYFINTRASKNATLKAKFYFTDTTNLSKDLGIFTFNQYRKFGFNTRYDLILTTSELAGKVCTHYEIFLQDDAANIISEKRTYYLNYEVKDYVRYFIFWNGWGALDSVITYGKASTAIELNQSESNRIRQSGYDLKAGDKFQFDLSINNSFKTATGFISRKQLFYNREFYLSNYKFRLFGGDYLPINITSKSINETEDGNGLYAQGFEYKYNFDDDSYTEGDEESGFGIDGFVISTSYVVSPPSSIDLTPYLLKSEFYAFKSLAVSGENSTKTTFLNTLLESGILADIPSGMYTVPNTAIIELIPTFANPAAYSEVLLVRHVNVTGRLGFAIISSNDLANPAYLITFASVAGYHKVEVIGSVGGGGTPTLLKRTQSDLVPMDSGDPTGFQKLPITLAADQGVLWIKLLKGGIVYFLPIQYDNGYLLNFDNNSAQNIQVKIS